MNECIYLSLVLMIGLVYAGNPAYDACHSRCYFGYAPLITYQSIVMYFECRADCLQIYG